MAVLASSAREQQILRRSVYVVIIYIAISIVFAVLTRSDAILFDGLYSAISLSMAFLTLWVARLAARPDDDRFHFGYGALEPFLNLCKSLIIIAVCVFAAIAAGFRLLAGGSEAAYGLGIYYGVVATIVCLGMAFYMRRANDALHSDLVDVEARTWFMDGLLSAAVLLGFAVAWLLNQSSWQAYAPLADPIIVIMLVAVAIPVPLGILLASVREVIAMAPTADFVGEVERRLYAALAEVETDFIEYRVSKRGRSVQVLVHVVVAKQLSTLSVEELDRIRQDCITALRSWNENLRLDMIFTRDRAVAD